MKCNEQSISRSAVSDAWTRSERFCALNKGNCAYPSAPDNGRQAAEDLIERIKSVIRMTATAAHELKAQRWYFNSLAASEFVLRRHETADAAMEVFGLSHGTARRLYDQTVLEARRVLINGRPVRIVPPYTLRRTSMEALIRFSAYLSQNDFSKLAVLTKVLPPKLILLVKPENAPGFRVDNAELIRQNLGLILDGDPAARLLFAQ